MLSLQLQLRSEEGNLFARLSPEDVQKLRHEAVLARKDLEAHMISEDDYWVISDDFEMTGTCEFLPLAVTLPDSTVLFTSFNGSASAESGFINLPRSMIPPGPPSLVQVRALPFVRKCKRIELVPVTTSDWELLELSAQSLEAGDLLNQVCVVYNQTLSLQTSQGLARVTAKIVENNDTGGSRGEHVNDSPACTLLLQHSEVIIAPKPRSNDGLDKERTWTFRLQPARGDLCGGIEDISLPVSASFISAPPGCLLIGDGCALGSEEFVWISREGKEGVSKRVLARTLRSPTVPESYAVLHPLLRVDLGLALYYDSVRVEIADLVEIKEISLNEVVLQPLQIENGFLSNPRWLKPICSDEFTVPDFLSCNGSTLLQESDTLVLAKGSIVPAYWSKSRRHCTSGFFRLDVLKNPMEYDAQEYVAILTTSDIDELLLKRCSRSHIVEASNPIKTPPTDAMASIVPISRDCVHQNVECEWNKKLLRVLAGGDSHIFLKHGPPGIGKTHVCLRLAALARIQQTRATIYLDCKKLRESSPNSSDILNEIDTIFRSSLGLEKSLILLDDLDCLAPNLGQGSLSNVTHQSQEANQSSVAQSKLITDRILQLFHALSSVSSAQVSLLVTCSSEDSLNESIRDHKGCYSCDAVTELSRKNRVELLRATLHERVALGGKVFQGVGELNRLEVLTNGFRPRDIVNFSCQVSHKALSQENNILEKEILEDLREYSPLSKLVVDKQQSIPEVDWSSIGGLFDVKSRLDSTLLQPSKYRLIYSSGQVRLPNGILLFGPSGCGKSVLVPALAKRCNFPLITCKGPEVLDRYIGSSEAKVRELFMQAASVAPSILFLDELDALAPRRGSDHTGVTDRVVNQLLTFLDGVEEMGKSKAVYVIGCTSRPDKIDPALLRPGRLEQHLFVGPPENEEQYLDLFSKIGSRWNVDENDKVLVNSLNFVRELHHDSPHSRSFSPADIKSVFDSAQIRAVRRALDQKTLPTKVFITAMDIKEVIATSKPSLSENELRELYNIYRPFLNGSSSADSLGGVGVAAATADTTLPSTRLRTALY